MQKTWYNIKIFEWFPGYTIAFHIGFQQVLTTKSQNDVLLAKHKDNACQMD